MDKSELEDLDQLVNSDGWKRFSQMVQDTYGRGGERFFTAVTNAAKGDNPHAQDHLRQILAEQRGALDAVAMVPNRIKLLKQATAQPTPVYIGSRRGGA